MDVDAIAGILSDARDRDSGARSSALYRAEEAFKENRDPLARQLLLVLARYLATDCEPTNRSSALDVLWRCGKPQDYRAAVLLAADEYWPARATAFSAMGALGGKKSLRRLLSGMRDKNPIVRRYAAYALAEVEGPASIPLLTEAIAREVDPLARVGILSGLALFGSADALRELEELSHDRDKRVSSPAKHSVDEIRGTNSAE